MASKASLKEHKRISFQNGWNEIFRGVFIAISFLVESLMTLLVTFLNVFPFSLSQFWVIMSPLVRFGYGSIVQSDSPADSIQFVICSILWGKRDREREREMADQEKISFSIRKTESLHAMHNKPSLSWQTENFLMTTRTHCEF